MLKKIGIAIIFVIVGMILYRVKSENDPKHMSSPVGVVEVEKSNIIGFERSYEVIDRKLKKAVNDAYGIEYYYSDTQHVGNKIRAKVFRK